MILGRRRAPSAGFCALEPVVHVRAIDLIPDRSDELPCLIFHCCGEKSFEPYLLCA
jgi:hypothetical protein